MGCSQSKASEPKETKAASAPPSVDQAAKSEALPAAALQSNGGAAAGGQDAHPGAESPAAPGIVHAPSAPAVQAPGRGVPESSPVAAPAAQGGDAGAAPTEPGLSAAGPAGPGRISGGALAATDSQGRRSRPARTMPAAFADAMFNGFKTLPELQSFDCPEEQQAPYSGLKECLSYQPAAKDVVTVFKNGDQERKIHNNIELSASEVERLQGMREEAKTQGLEFYPSVTAMATRFLSRARMDPRKAVKLMKETNDWRKEYFKDGPLTAASVQEDLKTGVVYFGGRDHAMRPVIVIRANRIPPQWYKEKCIDRFIRMLVFCMEYFMRYICMPGRVENVNVIVDLATLGISQVPLSALHQVYSVMSHHYIGRVYKFYVINISLALSTIASMAKALLTDRQKQKLNILDDVKELRQDFALSQLEVDLGGNRPKESKFFPFPMLPGPFEAGHPGPVDMSAPTRVHEALSHAGAIGRLWDPKQSPEENRSLEYSARAAEIFERCGLPVPLEARLETEQRFVNRTGSALSTPPPPAGPQQQTLPVDGVGDGIAQIAQAEAPREDKELVELKQVMVDDDVDLRHEEVLGGVGKSRDRDLSSAVICGGRCFCCDVA